MTKRELWEQLQADYGSDAKTVAEMIRRFHVEQVRHKNDGGVWEWKR